MASSDTLDDLMIKSREEYIKSLNNTQEENKKDNNSWSFSSIAGSIVFIIIFLAIMGGLSYAAFFFGGTGWGIGVSVFLGLASLAFIKLVLFPGADRHHDDDNYMADIPDDEYTTY
jgi:hypothetical protein